MPLDLLQRSALLGRRRYRTLFAVAALVLGLSALLVANLRFDTDVLNLLPHDQVEVDTFRSALEEFGSLDMLLVAVRIPEGAVVDPYLEFVDRVGEELESSDRLADVEYRIGELDEVVGQVFPEAVFFLDAEGRDEILRRLGDEALRRRAREIRRALSTPQGLVLKSLLTLDPVGLAEIFLDRITGSRAGLAIDWTSGYFLSRDHGIALILTQPVSPPQDVEFCRELAAEMERRVESVKHTWAEVGGEGEPPRVDLAGRHLTALSDESVIRKDVIVNVGSSMVGVLALFLFAFRRFGPLLYAFVPLAGGLLMTFGFASLTLGRISFATSGAAGLLIGLGIDFVIVSYGRFVEERSRGRSLEEALVEMNGSSGRAVILGGVTSAATFYAFAVTDFTGLRQMGLLTGTGILLCMVSVVLLLPAMLSWHEDRHHRRERVPRLVLHGFGSGRVIRWSLARPRTVLAIGIALTLVAALEASGVRFDDSVQSMRPPDNRTVEVRDEIAQAFGSGFDAMMLVVSGDSIDEVLERVEVAAAGSQELVDRGVLTSFDAVTSVLPSPRRQEAALAWIADQRAAGRLDLDRIRTTFDAGLQDAGLRPQPFARGLDLLGAALDPPPRMHLEELRSSSAGSKLLDRYLQPDGEGWRGVIYLYPPPKQWRREPPPQAVAMADELGPWAVLTGSNVVSALLRRTVLRDAWVAGILGLILVAILLWVDLRRVRHALLALGPLLFGLVWMVGAMVLLDIPMNFMNIFVSTMIIGIGVDYGIHMVHRYREVRAATPERFEHGLVQTGKAIAMAALSTTVGFGSLSLSHYPGLQSMGKVAILGALGTCLVAITMLPAVLVLRRGR